ncbi:MAG: acyl-CoA dehydratase activase-related protein [Thermovirgaceae bacterium]|nr:acyl-CoA dehydratase activase-related protein [Thermovirgaceae bacterium]
MAAISTELFAGFDIGSAALHCSVVSADRSVVYSPPPSLHRGKPVEALRNQWQEMMYLFPPGSIVSTSFTGIGSAHFPEVFPGVLREHDSICIVRGAKLASPESGIILHLGAKDAYFFRVAGATERPILLDWSTSSKCGAGSGTLLEKQVRRLFPLEEDDPESFGKMLQLAELEAGAHGDFGGYNARCGVVLQSDLIHDQNEGMSRDRIMARLFRTIAVNIVQDVIGNRDLEPGSKAALTGWMAGCGPILEHIREITPLNIERPAHFTNVGAAGAALIAIERGNRSLIDISRIGEVIIAARSKRQYAPPLSDFLARVFIHTASRHPVREKMAEAGEVVIGVDGGSTTTKAVVVSLETGEFLGGEYVSTHGNPLGALAEIMRRLSSSLGNPQVAGVCTTGSARKLFERVLSSPAMRKRLEDDGKLVPDGAIDEITCHAMGIRSMDGDIDTIFEIGGQDMKFTTFRRDGERATDEVDEARMNYSCQAGAGQTLENMAMILGLDVKDSLQEEALRAERVPVIDATCGVFMEMEEHRLIAENHTPAEVAAAIVRATASSYFNKFVGGSRHVREKCSCQGGPALGKAFLAAMAGVTGQEIHAYPNRELMGALGAALFSRDRVLSAGKSGLPASSAFRGWNAAGKPFFHFEKSCRDHFGNRSCGKRDCTLKVFSIGGEEMVTGGFCPLGNSEGTGVSRPDYVRVFHSLVERHFDGVFFDGLEKVESDGRPVIGIRRCTTTIGSRAVWSSVLFSALGFLPVLSPVSDERISRLGLRHSPTDFCVAMKISAGHTALLAGERRIDHIFIPGLIDRTRDTEPAHMFCIYTEAEAFLPADDLGLSDSRIIRPVWHLGDRKQMAGALSKDLARVGHEISAQTIIDAFQKADSREEAFRREIAATGDRFLALLEERAEKGYVGLGRDYVVLDPAASSDTGRMFSSVRGMNYIPQTFLSHLYAPVPVDDLVPNEYWEHSSEIIKASIFTARHERLFPIRQMNFACGPDSIKFMMEDAIFRRAGKPFLHILTDAQTNNAPFVTRAEAFERVVSGWRPRETPMSLFSFARKRPDVTGGRRWLIPSMGNSSLLAAATCRHWGLDALTASTATPEAREAADRLISTETCFPLKGVIGDIISHLEREAREKGQDRVNEEYLVLLPTTSGPCRFGKYAEVMGITLDSLGFGGVPILSPTTANGYMDAKSLGLPWSTLARAGFMRDIYNSFRAADLYDDLVLRFRPYALDRDLFRETSQKRLWLLEERLEKNGASLKRILEWAEESTRLFRALSRPDAERYPLVLYLGEIYMRQHDPYTGHVAEMLEAEGLELVRGPMTEWLRYVIHISERKDPRLEYKAAAMYINYAEKIIRRETRDSLSERNVIPHPEDTLVELERSQIYHADIRGESAISVGIFNSFLKGGLTTHPEHPVCGIFHVGPFTCMQEGVATARIRGMIKAKRRTDPNLIVPTMHASFGESPNPNLEAEIAAFREQCHLLRDSIREEPAVV